MCNQWWITQQYSFPCSTLWGALTALPMLPVELFLQYSSKQIGEIRCIYVILGSAATVAPAPKSPSHTRAALHSLNTLCSSAKVGGPGAGALHRPTCLAYLSQLTSSYVWPNEAQHNERESLQPTVTVTAPGTEGMAAAQAEDKGADLTSKTSLQCQNNTRSMQHTFCF